MQATIGKHAGTAMEVLMLKQPGYINWLLDYPACGLLAPMKQEAIRLVNVFDVKSFADPCTAEGCATYATRMTVYAESVVPMFWCDQCDPYRLGAKPGQLNVIRTYQQALAHVTNSCYMRKASYREIVLKMAHAKGLSDRVGVREAEAFFNQGKSVGIETLSAEYLM